MNSKKIAVVLSTLALVVFVLGLMMFGGSTDASILGQESSPPQLQNLISAPSDGTTRYVSPGGSDTANDCTNKQKPCRHVQYAVGVASAGDTISLDTGTYVEQVTIGINLTLTG